LSSTNTEKHLRVSHNKESHKVKVLARIYFSMAGKSIERGGVQEKKKHFLPSRSYTGELGDTPDQSSWVRVAEMAVGSAWLRPSWPPKSQIIGVL
jgi:hypothetical protein